MKRKSVWALCAMLGALGCSKASSNGGGDGDESPQLSNRSQSTAALRTFSSCENLLEEMRTHIEDQALVQLYQQREMVKRGGGPVFSSAEDAAAPTASADAAGASNTNQRQEGVDFSGTNNQEAGVDEADFAKTDGYHMYLINGRSLRILSIPEFGDLNPVSDINIEGWPYQMLQSGNKVVVFSSVNVYDLPQDHPIALRVRQSRPEWDYFWYRISSVTKLTVIDTTQKDAPQMVKEVYIEGDYRTARKVGSSIRMITYAWTDIPGVQTWPTYPENYWELSEAAREAALEQAIERTVESNHEALQHLALEDFIPRMYVRNGSGSVEVVAYNTANCENFSIADDSMARGVTSVLSLDVLDETFAFDSDHIVSNASEVYASLDTLVVAEPAQDWWWYWGQDTVLEATNIHRFDISQPGQTLYTGSGRVPGTLLGQFALSEWNGAVRVASTTGQWNRWWMQNPTPSNNHVYVLEGENSLEIVGSVSDIGVGERLWSSRFVEDKAYLVTFRNIDPLWTIDLSTPHAPRIVGELEVPGVSTYIHPISEQELLTIGYGGNEEGLDWSTQVSLFNVSDFAHPSTSAQLSLKPTSAEGDWAYAWSEAQYEHKAFTYWAPKQLLAIPLTTYRSYYSPSEDGYRYEYVSKLQLIHVANGGLTLAGNIDHSAFYNQVSEYYWSSIDVRRAFFMGNYVYAISDKGITVHALQDNGAVVQPAHHTVSLPGTQYVYEGRPGIAVD
jgi:uncharacterized secreted protein with C-terminal beta-propeller domain